MLDVTRPLLKSRYEEANPIVSCVSVRQKGLGARTVMNILGGNT